VFDVTASTSPRAAMELVAENPGNVSEWLTDNGGRLRVAVTTDGVQSSRSTARLKGPLPDRGDQDFKNTLYPLFFQLRQSTALRRLQLSDAIRRPSIFTMSTRGQLLDLVYEHPEVDVSGLLRSKARQVITGSPSPRTTPVPGSLTPSAGSCRGAGSPAPRAPGAVTGHERDDGRVIVRRSTTKSLGACYLYEHSSGRLEKLAS